MKRYFNSFTFSILPIYIIFILLGIVSFGFAADYTFKWDANHSNDQVVAYRIYWSHVSGTYKASDRLAVPISSLSDPEHPQWTLSNTELDPGETTFFVCTAVDNRGLESGFSGEINTTTPQEDYSPPPETDTTQPVITTSPSASTITHNSAIITWRTDEASDGEVRYDDVSTTWGNYGNWETSSNRVTAHSIILTGLSPDTIYYFRVRSRDAAGNFITSSQLSFRTTETSNNLPPPEADTTPPVLPHLLQQGTLRTIHRSSRGEQTRPAMVKCAMMTSVLSGGIMATSRVPPTALEATASH